MGWTKQWIDKRPNNEELNRLVDELLAREDQRTLDRSSWMNHGRHQFRLEEFTDPRTGEKSRFIEIVEVRYSGQWFYWCVDNELSGPRKENCPLRLLDQLEDHPPKNEYARRWRERVRQYHADRRATQKVLKKLRKEYPHGERQVVLSEGHITYYIEGNYRGRLNVSAYLGESGQPVLLRESDIDAKATLELWEGKQTTGKETGLPVSQAS